jgi:hypothetical protein
VYQKTRSKLRQRSLVESQEEEDEDWQRQAQSRDWESSRNLKSVDFSTTTESTDSGGELSSAPNTPGEVFLERTSAGVGGSLRMIGEDHERQGPTFPDRVESIDDLYIPEGSLSLSSLSPLSGTGSSALGLTRQKLTDHLMNNMDDDGSSSYFLQSPASSRQPTVEKASTLTDNEADRLEKELGGEFRYPENGHGERGVGGRNDSRSSGRNGGSVSVGNTALRAGHKTVSIIVSADERGRHTAVIAGTPNSAQPGLVARGDSNESTGGGNSSSNFLNVDNSAADRMSDSGSDLTLVEQQSSSSGGASPRLLRDGQAGTGSPTSERQIIGAWRSRTMQDSGFDSKDSASAPLRESTDSVTKPARGRSSEESVVSKSSVPSCETRARQLEQGPVLFVYHKKQGEGGRGGSRGPTPDENDNYPTKFKTQVRH